MPEEFTRSGTSPTRKATGKMKGARSAPGPAQKHRGSSGRECRLSHSGLRGLRGALLHRQEELELRRKLLLGVQAIREVDAAQTAVRVDLNAKRLDVIRPVRAAREVRQVELDLVPAFVQTHRHRANEWLHTCGRLVVQRAEPAADVLV